MNRETQVPIFRRRDPVAFNADRGMTYAAVRLTDRNLAYIGEALGLAVSVKSQLRKAKLPNGRRALYVERYLLDHSRPEAPMQARMGFVGDYLVMGPGRQNAWRLIPKQDFGRHFVFIQTIPLKDVLCAHPVVAFDGCGEAHCRVCGQYLKTFEVEEYIARLASPTPPPATEGSTVLEDAAQEPTGQGEAILSSTKHTVLDLVYEQLNEMQQEVRELRELVALCRL